MSASQGNATSTPNLTNRLHFLYKVIEDTQATIRFLDTKAAFCVTLASGMAAVMLQRSQPSTMLAHTLLMSFLAAAVLTLLVCLRVIFPTIRISGQIGKPADPKFYVGHNKAHHWLLHTLSNPVDNVLSETHDSYVSALHHADDVALLASLTDTVLMTALIRQVKSDRLHAALFCLGGAIVLFALGIVF